MIDRYNLVLLLLFLLFFEANGQLNIQFRGQLTYGASNELANIGGYVDSTGKEYALVGCQTGLSIVDVSNPTTPIQKILIPGTNSVWREVKIWGKYAYVTTEGGSNGLQIINLSKLPGTITTSDYKYWKGTGAILNLLTKMHSLHIDNGYAYLNGANGGALFGGASLIVSLADPWNPVYIGNTQVSFVGNTNKYIHDCYVRNDTLWGAHIYAGFFSVINVANKAAPVLLGTQTTPGVFTHNTWLSTSGARTLFTTDEVSNSFMTAYDVNNIGNITELDKVQMGPTSGAIVHNTHIKNNFAIVSWYTQGVVIVDVNRPDNLIITGYYDTYPQSNGNTYNGCWGVYPYLPSGNLVASDINNGLFVLTPTYLRGCYLEGTITDTCTGLPLPTVVVTINGANINKQSKITGIYKTGTATAGTYSVTFSKTGYISKTITGVVLNNGVLTSLNVALKPASSVSITGAVTTNVSCNGGQNGALNVSASGGTLPYSWQWNDGVLTEDRTSLSVKTYTVTVTDMGGCKSSVAFPISQPLPLVLTFSSILPFCLTGDDGVIKVIINGGTGPFNVQWANIAPRIQSRVNQILAPSQAVTDSFNINNLQSGTYSITVTDAHSCSATANYILLANNIICPPTLKVRVFTEGLYRLSNRMIAAINPTNSPGIADTFIIKLANNSPPYNILFSNTVRVDTNGWVNCYFPSALLNRGYYIVVRHRNGIETWSKTTIVFNGSTVIYDFTK